LLLAAVKDRRLSTSLLVDLKEQVDIGAIDIGAN
jgi:hypothetical protein